MKKVFLCLVGAAVLAGLARPATADDRVSVLFVGDIMLDGGPGHLVACGKDPFEHCAALLDDADFTIGNLECVLGSKGKQLLKSYTFRAAPGSETPLKRYFSALSLANNHTADFGSDGFAESLRLLKEAEIPHFGGGSTLEEARKPLILEKDGVRIALLGYNGFRAKEYAATETAAGSAPLYAEMAVADVRRVRESKVADVIIPFLHWGDEMIAMPDADQRGLARELIDAGASAVIGSHPHVVQTVDVYRGRPIVYSLGNFVFDYFPEDPEEWTGWAVRLTFSKGDSNPVDLETFAVTLDSAGIPRPVDTVSDGPTIPVPPASSPVATPTGPGAASPPAGSTIPRGPAATPPGNSRD